MTRPRVVLATSPEHSTLTQSDSLLIPALEGLGMVVEAVPWDAIPPGGDDSSLVCLRSTWDYHLRPKAFRSWVEAFSSQTSRLWNPPETVLWNLDKSYLRDLANQGISLPPTRWFEPGEVPDLPALFRETGWNRLVLKPRVSATAHRTHLLTPADDLADLQWAPSEETGVVVQAYVPDIVVGGEISLVFLAGAFSHAVRKRPARGDFRVQPEHGGLVARESASKPLRDFGEEVLEAVPLRWVYARVDVIERSEGPLLMELELIEPELFFDYAPGSAVVLAKALAVLMA